MSFLHLGLLSLVPLATIPIALHLLTLHRVKTIELSTFRFLFDTFNRQRRQIKFLEAILAVLRTLFLLFMVLVVARPVVRQWPALVVGASSAEAIMLVDCSASMNARTAGRSSIDRARTAAAALAGRLDPNTRLTLVRVTSREEIVFSRFSTDADAIRQKIEGLVTSPSRANVFGALTGLFGSTANRQPHQTIYFFTDCQASGWREVKEQGIEKILPPESKLIVINVGPSAPHDNRAVVGEAPAEVRVVAGLPVVLRSRVMNHSTRQAAEITVAATLDERDVGRATIALKPGESSTRELVHIPREPGTLRGRFEIGADSFADDDTFLFTLNVVPAIKVVLVNGVASRDPLESETLFIRTAFEAQPDSSPKPDARKPADNLAQLRPNAEFVRSLDVQEITESALNPAALDGASAVILANTGALNPQHFAWLRDYVAGGGGLMIFPGDRVNHEVFTRQFFAAPAAQPGAAPAPARRPAAKTVAPASPTEPLVEVKLGAPFGELERIEQSEKLANIAFGHPVFNVFDDPKVRYLTTAQFFRRFKLEVPADHSATWPLAFFAGGDPAIVESRLGFGKVLVAAFPVNSKWSNLPLKPEFVPLVLRMVSHVMRPAEIEAPSVVPPGAGAEIVLSHLWAPATAKVTDPARRVSALTFERSEGRLAAAFTNTSEKGFYHVEINGGPAEQSRNATAEFAVNLSPDESNFAMISETDLHEWLPGADVKLVDASDESQEFAGRLGDGREIWRPVIVLMFAIIAVEFLLATLGGVIDKDSPTVAQRIREFSPVRWAARLTGAAEDVAPR